MATNYGNGSWTGVLFDREATPTENLTLTFTTPEPLLSVTPAYSEPLPLTPDFDTPEPELTVTITFAGENALTATFDTPEPVLEIDFGMAGSAYTTADFVAPEPELSITPLYSTPWTLPSQDYDVPEPVLEISGVSFIEIVYLPNADFVTPEPILTIDADINMALTEDLFNPTEFEIELDVFLTFEIPYATPPGGLYETDGTEIIAPNLAYVPEV